MYIRRFKYKPDDVDCRLCTEFKKRKCTLEGCPWIAERIEAGVVSYAEAVMKVFSSYGLLRHRLADLVDSYPGTFWIDERHRNRMEWFNHQLGYNPRRNTPAYYAALYLLTSSEELHRRTSNCFYRKGLAFEFAILKGISLHDYALYAVACDLNTGTARMTVGDLAERAMVNDSAFRLIINAILIAKYGTDVFKLRKEPVINVY